MSLSDAQLERSSLLKTVRFTDTVHLLRQGARVTVQV